MSLLDSPLLLEHKHQVLRRVDELSTYINSGNCSTLEEYKKKTGIIEGLNVSLELMASAVKVYANDDDDEDDF